MVVVGKHCIIFDDTGKICTVNAFSESAGKLDNVLIVDAAVAYGSPYQCKTFILFMQNALYIPELEINLLPPFIVRESGNQINKCPKIQTSDPSIDYHTMYISSCTLRIPFKLLNIFSYFETRMPIAGELGTCDKVFIIPDSSTWNPHSDHYAINEQVMLDDDENVRTIESKSRNIVEEKELNYPTLPSMNYVYAYINSILANSHENDDLIKHAICYHGAEPNAQMMDNEINNWIINGKIFMATSQTLFINHEKKIWHEINIRRNAYHLLNTSM